MIMTKYKFLIFLMTLIVLVLLSMVLVCRTCPLLQSQKADATQQKITMEETTHLIWHTGCGCCTECTCMHREDDRIQYKRIDHTGKCWCAKDCQCACTHDVRESGNRHGFCGCYHYEEEIKARRKNLAEEEKRREKSRIERTRPKGATERCDQCNATGLDDGALCFRCNGWGRVEVNK